MANQGGEEAVGEWGELFDGIEALVGLTSVRRAWVGGLRCVAPGDVLVRLLDMDSSVLDYLPADALDAAIAHPDRRIRGRLAEIRRDMGVDQWARLIAGEEAGTRRDRFRALAVWHCPRPDVDRFARWARDPDPQVRLRALWFRGLPEPLALALAGDPDPEVRAEACGPAWAGLDAARRSALLADPAPEVREAARLRARYDRPMACTEFDALGTTEQWRAVPVQLLARDLAEHLVRHPESGLRATLVRNERLDPDLITALAHDDDPHVRASVAVRADVSEALRAAIHAGLPASTAYWRVGWVEELHDDPEAMRRLAGSASIAIRRTVAGARHLPPDVVDRLARDPDHQVPYKLATCCADATAELLLELAQRRSGGHLALDHPNFPRHDLLRFADDPDPLRRRLALESPESTSDLAERLADDPDERVRARAAADPRLSPATVLRLLDSTPQTREAALRNPRLPVPVLIRHLRATDPATAGAAAANPAIPPTVVRRLAQLCLAAQSSPDP
ncbi:PE-PGRS family protein [Streptomyces sp. NPDC047014]|uniref:PE-PGRS family protein n=1 Tax=Streptomyces sp. NPDC047014 TaxID=3155736 RepID=UPI0033F46683